MENSLYIGLSRQMALQEQMDLVANNIANLATPGYRGQNMVFLEYLAKQRNAEKPATIPSPWSMTMASL